MIFFFLVDHPSSPCSSVGIQWSGGRWQVLNRTWAQESECRRKMDVVFTPSLIARCLFAVLLSSRHIQVRILVKKQEKWHMLALFTTRRHMRLVVQYVPQMQTLTRLRDRKDNSLVRHCDLHRHWAAADGRTILHWLLRLEQGSSNNGTTARFYQGAFLIALYTDTHILILVQSKMSDYTYLEY